MKRLRSAVLLLCLAASPVAVLGPVSRAAAQAIPYVGDPAENTQRLMKLLEEQGAEPLSDELTRLFRNDKPNPVLTEQMRPFSRKVADVTSVVYDKTYGDAVRLMLVYKQYESGPIPFVYYQFTYKKMKAGWVLTNFRFKSEAAQAFPEGYTAP